MTAPETQALDGAALLERFLLPAPAPGRELGNPRLRRRDEALLARAHVRTVEVADLPVVTYRWGGGPTVLLAHGWSSRAAHMAAFVEPLLAAGYGVTAPDMPGHGRSGGHLSNLYLFAGTLLALAAEVGEVAGVIGHSGGALATLMALREGLATRRVVALAPMVRLETAASRFGAGTGASPDAQRAFMAGMTERFGQEVWARTAGDLLAPDLAVGGLLLHDPEDDETPYAETAVLAEVWPGARLLPTPGLGHRRLLRHPETVAAAVAFLRRTTTWAVSPEGRQP